MKPQVLLLGNGLNIHFQNDKNWKSLLTAISRRPDIDPERLTWPMPLRAILLTNNHVDSALKENREGLSGTRINEKYRDFLSQMRAIMFDEILTTNYSYELEADENGEIPDNKQLLKMLRHTDAVKRAENRYLLHTYNQIKSTDGISRVWHIHGEARKPESIIIGHYWYANYLTKMKSILDKKYSEEDIFTTVQPSWADSFVLGDVYILAFGFDQSEMDLWWLINRKQREKAETGKTYWFEPRVMNDPTAVDEKRELLRCLGVQCEDLGFIGTSYDDIDFDAFYSTALETIKNMVAANRK